MTGWRMTGSFRLVWGGIVPARPHAPGHAAVPLTDTIAERAAECQSGFLAAVRCEGVEAPL